MPHKPVEVTKAEDKVTRLLEAVNRIAKSADDDLKAELVEFPEVDKLVEYVNKYEAKIAKLLKAQRKFFVDSISSFVAKDAVTIRTVLLHLYGELVVTDEFEAGMSQASDDFLNATVPEITATIMGALDPDIPFNLLSDRTITWIEGWSKDLGKLMKLTSHQAVEKVLTDALAEGSSIDKVITNLKDLPQFTRVRARRTAITEVLTANSASQQEAYSQSPAVSGKKWRHSGARRITPRENHQALDGTVVPVDGYFDVGGYNASYPRDTVLPAKERVFCHCVLSPEVDPDVLGLSKDEKEAIRQRVLADLGTTKGG